MQGPQDRERELNRNFFSSNFSGAPGISRQKPGFRRTCRTFWPPVVYRFSLGHQNVSEFSFSLRRCCGVGKGIARWPPPSQPQSQRNGALRGATCSGLHSWVPLPKRSPGVDCTRRSQRRGSSCAEPPVPLGTKSLHISGPKKPQSSYPAEVRK